MFLFFLITGLITSTFFNGYLQDFYSKRKLFDPVNVRSSHNEKATRSGGLALFLTLCFCYGVGRAFLDLDINLFSLIACCFVALIGFFDDLFDELIDTLSCKRQSTMLNFLKQNMAGKYHSASIEP